VRAKRLNHVSIHASDMEESLRFYVEVFGMERLPSPNFSQHVEWLRLGDQQLHLFKRDAPAPEFHHIALDVDDFEAAYLKARELGILDEIAFGASVRELPGGAVQMYIRDPAGNLVEVDWPDISTLDRNVVTNITRLADERPQTGDAARAALYHAAD
jgi:catechol 2,3-dioxygenase-like lactoylglutathione lyase family enzyme